MPDVHPLVVVAPLDPNHGRLSFVNCSWAINPGAGHLHIYDAAEKEIAVFHAADLLGWWVSQNEGPPTPPSFLGMP